jgi:hypothetical protein
MNAKLVHMAALVNDNGGVLALCFLPHPRRINLDLADWTIRPEAVTCGACVVAAMMRPGWKCPKKAADRAIGGI